MTPLDTALFETLITIVLSMIPLLFIETIVRKLKGR